MATGPVPIAESRILRVERASGSRKWDVDGNEYVDYLGGRGALILGHNHPAVVDAVIRQAESTFDLLAAEGAL